MLVQRLNALLPLVRSSWVGAVLALNLLLYFLFHVLPGHLESFWPVLVPFGDAEIIFAVSGRIWQVAAYPAQVVFPFPPSAVVIFPLLSRGSGRFFMATWIILMAAAMLIIMYASVDGERSDVRAAWMVLGVCGLILAGYPVGWDLRNASSSLIYLGLVLAG